MPNIQLAKNLRFLRKQNGLTQETLKDMLNISRQAYSNYETSSRMPDLDTLVRIAQFYHLSLDDLVLRDLSLPSFEGMMEAKPPYMYMYAECKKTGDSIYLTEEELDYVADFRSLPKETRQIITGFLDSTRTK